MENTIVGVSLFDERGMFLDADLAMRIGMNEALVLQQLKVCLHEPSSTIMEGRRWVRSTYREWQTLFPFWSTTTIKRTFKSLQRQGLVLVEQHGNQCYDQTNWYTVVDG